MNPTNPKPSLYSIGPLATPKTITMTFVPDWRQSELNSPLRSASLQVLLGPANTTPETASWSFEFNITSIDTGAPSDKGEEPIPYRALLWQNGKPFGKFKNCVVLNRCNFPDPNLAPSSLTLRPYSGKPRHIPLLRNQRIGERRDLSYLKVQRGIHYYLNITFPVGSLISQNVGMKNWRPTCYLNTKSEENGVDVIKTHRLFTNFVANWASGVELPSDLTENKEAQDFLELEKIEELQYLAAKELQAQQYLAAKVEQMKLDTLQPVLAHAAPKDQLFITNTLKNYSAPKGFCKRLAYAVFRIWNAIKSIFRKSDWIKARALFQNAIEAAPWFLHLKDSRATVLAETYMRKFSR